MTNFEALKNDNIDEATERILKIVCDIAPCDDLEEMRCYACKLANDDEYAFTSFCNKHDKNCVKDIKKWLESEVTK